MTQEELLSIIDPAAGQSPGDSAWAKKEPTAILLEQTRRALFDKEVRSEWSGTKFWVMYGGSTAWLCIWPVWYLEKEDTSSQLHFKEMPDANHFVSRAFESRWFSS